MPDEYTYLMENYARWVKEEDERWKDYPPIPMQECECPPKEEQGGR